MTRETLRDLQAWAAAKLGTLFIPKQTVRLHSARARLRRLRRKGLLSARQQRIAMKRQRRLSKQV